MPAQLFRRGAGNVVGAAQVTVPVMLLAPGEREQRGGKLGERLAGKRHLQAESIGPRKVPGAGKPALTRCG